MMLRPRNPLAPIDAAEQHELPIVWLIVGGLVFGGMVANLTINLFASGGLSVWPFVFAISTLLVLNDASDRNGVGIPPLQAYGLVLGVLVLLMLFVWFISHVNPFVLLALVALLGGYVGYDWRQRQKVAIELARRRIAGLCIKCLTPVSHELEAICDNCGFPVHPDRLTLLRLGRAIGQMGNKDKVRQTLAKNAQQSQAPKRGSSTRPITKAYSYGKKK